MAFGLSPGREEERLSRERIFSCKNLPFISSSAMQQLLPTPCSREELTLSLPFTSYKSNSRSIFHLPPIVCICSGVAGYGRSVSPCSPRSLWSAQEIVSLIFLFVINLSVIYRSGPLSVLRKRRGPVGAAQGLTAAFVSGFFPQVQ